MTATFRPGPRVGPVGESGAGDPDGRTTTISSGMLSDPTAFSAGLDEFPGQYFSRMVSRSGETDSGCGRKSAEAGGSDRTAS
jgi:hypothetical protein